MIDKIMLAIHHNHAENILNGLKEYEMRKTAPKDSHTYIIYLYETKQEYTAADGYKYLGEGAVTGFFVCKARIKTNAFGSGLAGDSAEENAARRLIAKRACLTMDELIAYANNKDIYIYVVSTPIRFPRPRPLSDFGLKRAPQSWQYIK